LFEVAEEGQRRAMRLVDASMQTPFRDGSLSGW